VGGKLVDKGLGVCEVVELAPPHWNGIVSVQGVGNCVPWVHPNNLVMADPEPDAEAEDGPPKGVGPPPKPDTPGPPKGVGPPPKPDAPGCEEDVTVDVEGAPVDTAVATTLPTGTPWKTVRQEGGLKPFSFETFLV
jgi:hypothetical protein